MTKRKVYIFLVGTIGYGYWSVGGAEMYIAGKVNYLRQKGWQVYVCTPCPKKDGCAISSLNEYLEIGAGWTFLATPPYKLKTYEQEQAMNFMLKRLNLTDYKNCEIIIESTWDFLGYWGELLASRLEARNINCMLNENYDESFYKDNLDFFYFKWKRNELISSEAGLKKLFNGYKGVSKPKVDVSISVKEQEPIQDIEVSNMDQLPKLDWNICYIGRILKPYVPAMSKGVVELAKKYPDKRIHYVIIGEASARMDMLRNLFANQQDILLTLLGDMVPIPRVLIKNMDVIMAGAQSAMFAANEGVLTIAGDVDSEQTPGVLGYDTKDAWYGGKAFGTQLDEHKEYVEVLEDVLVKHAYEGKKSTLEKMKPANEYYEKFWELIEKAESKKEYYVEKLTKYRGRTKATIFPFGIIEKNKKVIIYGANEIRKDYLNQVTMQNYCKVITTVAENYEEYDDSVESMERLKTIDYDAIVVAVEPDEFDSACERILSIVPEVKDKIIYDYQTVDV